MWSMLATLQHDENGVLLKGLLVYVCAIATVLPLSIVEAVAGAMAVGAFVRLGDAMKCHFD